MVSVPTRRRQLEGKDLKKLESYPCPYEDNLIRAETEAYNDLTVLEQSLKKLTSQMQFYHIANLQGRFNFLLHPETPASPLNLTRYKKTYNIFPVATRECIRYNGFRKTVSDRKRC